MVCRLTEIVNRAILGIAMKWQFGGDIGILNKQQRNEQKALKKKLAEKKLTPAKEEAKNK